MLIRWPGSGQPLALANLDSVQPQRLGALGHLLGKRGFGACQPLGHHHAGIVARVDGDMPWIRSCTVGRSPCCRYIVEPPASVKLTAWAETAKVVSIATRPSFNASNSIFTVISLDIDAGGNEVSPFLSISTVWVVTS